MARLLILAGLALVGAGLLLKSGIPLGRLPGDVTFRSGSFTFYLPLATSLVASLVLSAIVAWLSRR